MKFLLDTHVFLWAISEPEKLSDTVRQIIVNGTNALLISVASLWEISIKIQIGKLPMPIPADQYLRTQLSRNAVYPLPIEASHALKLFSLPDIHRDLFDRLLIAQSLVENLPILTADPVVRQYAAETVW